MIRGLTRVPWERVDVSFRKSKQRFVAHSTIQVKFLSYSFPAKTVNIFARWETKSSTDKNFLVMLKIILSTKQSHVTDYIVNITSKGIWYTKEMHNTRLFEDDLLILS
jgi:preprotein translocase subunit SecB